MSLLAECRVHATRKGLLNLFDLYVKDWVRKTYDTELPRLPVDADLYLLTSTDVVPQMELSPPEGWLCASRY